MITVRDIIHVTAEHFEVSKAELLGKRRFRYLVYPRKVICHLAREMTGLSLLDLGRELNRDHSTIMHALETIPKLMREDEGMKKNVDDIRQKIWERAKDVQFIRHKNNPMIFRSSRAPISVIAAE